MIKCTFQMFNLEYCLILQYGYQIKSNLNIKIICNNKMVCTHNQKFDFLFGNGIRNRNDSVIAAGSYLNNSQYIFLLGNDVNFGL